MMRTTKIQGLMMATGLATLTLMQPAMALEAEAFADRITELYKLGGYQIEFGAATLEGDTVTIDGATISVDGVEDTWTVDTELTFTGVVETEDGGYTAETLTIPDIDTEFAHDPVGHLTLTDIAATDIILPPAEEVTTEALVLSIGSLTTGPLNITRDGADFLAIESISAVNEFTYGDADALEEVVSTFDIAGISANLSAMAEEDPQAGPIIEALGLTQINGDINQTMSWGMADGHLVIEQFLFDFADIGSINLTTDLSGFTPELLEKISAMEAASADATEEEAQAQEMMLGMEMLQALTLTSASLRYEDDSLANKLLDLFASQSGAERAQFVEGLKAMVPQMVGQLGVQELTDMVVPAVEAFLDDPQSFEVSVQPATPTTLLVLSAAAANPAGLISALGLDVSANEAAALQ